MRAGDADVALLDMAPCWYHVEHYYARARAAAAAESSATKQAGDSEAAASSPAQEPAVSTHTAPPPPGKPSYGVPPSPVPCKVVSCLGPAGCLSVPLGIIRKPS